MSDTFAPLFPASALRTALSRISAAAAAAFAWAETSQHRRLGSYCATPETLRRISLAAQGK